MGGTMRLGAYECRLVPDSKSHALYGQGTISERHRHRYELNNAYRERLERHGLRIAGINPQRNLAEIIELPDHPLRGTQFTPTKAT
jgi:CTP synthase